MYDTSLHGHTIHTCARAHTERERERERDREERERERERESGWVSACVCVCVCLCVICIHGCVLQEHAEEGATHFHVMEHDMEQIVNSPPLNPASLDHTDTHPSPSQFTHTEARTGFP